MTSVVPEVARLVAVNVFCLDTSKVDNVMHSLVSAKRLIPHNELTFINNTNLIYLIACLAASNNSLSIAAAFICKEVVVDVGTAERFGFTILHN